MARNYSNASPELKLTTGVNNSVTTITVADDPIVVAPFAVVVTPDATKVTEEVMLVTAVTPNGGDFDLTVTRAYDGTTAKSHSADASVIHAVIALDMVDATSGGGGGGGYNPIAPNMITLF